MVIEITAFNNVAVLYPKLSNNIYGFVYNIHWQGMKTLDIKHDLMKKSKLDLAYTNYPYIWESYDNNSKVKIDSTTTNTGQYNKIYFVAVPYQEEYCQK